MTDQTKEKKWYQKLPDAYVLLFMIIIVVTVLTYIVPAGEFQRDVDPATGRVGVVAGSYERVDPSPVGILEMFMAIPQGMVAAVSVSFIVFFAGALFYTIETTGALESGLAVLIRRLGSRPNAGIAMIWVVTFAFGLLGAVVGFENNIAIVPIGVMVAIALGYDNMVGAGVAVAAIGLGFATSPINPYTVGVSHAIADLPVFSGFGLRGLYMLVSLAVLAHHTARYAKRVQNNQIPSLTADIDYSDLAMEKDLDTYQLTGTHKIVILVLVALIGVIIFGTLQYAWYLAEITTVFLVGAIVIGLVARYDANKIARTMVTGAGKLVSGALIIGVARGIQVVMENGKIGDTIIHALAAPLENVGPLLSGILMSISHSVINFFIPSGSGQAMATMPIMIPLSDLVGISRQTAILAFQLGDGVMNLVIPTLGGLLAMIALARVPFDRWFKFIYPLVLKVIAVGWIFIFIAVIIGY